MSDATSLNSQASPLSPSDDPATGGSEFGAAVDQPSIDDVAERAPAEPAAPSAPAPYRPPGMYTDGGTEALALGCALLGAPLTEGEAEAFQRDLDAVLRKHGVQNPKNAEEWQLGLTAARILIPRAAARLFGDEGSGDAGPESREETEREDRGPTKAGVSTPAAVREELRGLV